MRVTNDFLFQSEDIVIEKSVEFFIGVINTQLFKTIDIKVLKTEYVEDSEESVAILTRVCAGVYVTDNPGKSPRVQCFGHRVSVLSRLMQFERNVSHSSPNIDLTLKCGQSQLICIHSKKCGHSRDNHLVVGTQFTSLSVQMVLKLEVS